MRITPIQKLQGEVLFGLWSAILLAITPMTWYIRAILAVFASLIAFDLLGRLNLGKKIGLLIQVLGAVAVVAINAPSIFSDFSVWQHAEFPAHIDQKKVKPVGNPLDNEISLSCETSERPTNYRNDGDLHTYELGAPPTYWGMPFPAAGADTWLSSGEGPINWAGMRPASFSKCTISNYSSSAILNAVVVIPAWYSLPIKTKTGFKTGSFITGRFVISPPLNLDPVTSPNNSNYFYIENDTKYFVQFPTPNTIQISLAGSNMRQTVKLIPPSMPIMGLWPVNPSTNPPN